MTLPIVSCEGCGACCLEQAAPPLYAYIAAVLASGDAKEIAGLEADEVYADDVGRVRSLPSAAFDELLAYFIEHGDGLDDRRPCLWLDRRTMRCRRYEHRPSICRDFERGCPECREWRAERITAALG